MSTIEIKSKVIPFNIEMSKAIIDGIKTQTRRVIKSKATSCFSLGVNCIEINLDEEYKYSIRNKNGAWNEYKTEEEFIKNYSRYKSNDTLWLREPAKVISFKNDGNYGGAWLEASAIVEYLADKVQVQWDDLPCEPKKWLTDCKGIPNGCTKSLARHFLKVINIRVERLQDISLSDIEREGIPVTFEMVMANNTDELIKNEWIKLWNKTAEKGFKWEDNPYVFVYDLEKISHDLNKN